MPKVSILVPIFNVEKYLRQCLDSVVAQTLRDIEIICINDGSTDGSLAIIEEYARRDSRVVVIDKANSGYGISMNQGLARATGEYIGIVESDDWVELDMFEKLVELGDKHKVEVVKTEFYSYYADPAKQALNTVKSELLLEHELGISLNPKYRQHIFFQQPSIWSAIYRRDFLRDNGIEFLPSPGASYQDTGFNFKVWASANRVLFSGDAYLHYRRDSEGSSVNNPGKVFCVSDEYDEIERFLVARNADDDLMRLMRACRWGGYRWNIDRLEPVLADDFIDLASKQYREEYESGIFKFEYCDVNFTRGIEEIMFQPEMVKLRRHARGAAKVSVIFPVYNVEEYVEQSLRSLLDQTLREIEVIVVDDGSLDGSMEIVEELYREDPRVRIQHQHNQGLSVARNTGLDLVSAEYVAFLDSDDTFEPDALERLYTAATEHDVQLVCGSSKVVFEINNRSAADKLSDRRYLQNKLRGEHEITPEVLDTLDVHVWNKLYLASAIKNHNIKFPPKLKYEDAFFLNAYAWSVDRCYFLDPEKPIHTYLRRPGAIMSDTFVGVNSADDHLEIVFLLFDEARRPENREKYGAYYLMLLDRYIHISLHHSSEQGHEDVWRQARLFVSEHARELRELDPERYDDLEAKVLPGFLRSFKDHPGLQRTALKAGIKVKAVMRGVRNVATANRRLQKENLEQVNAAGQLVKKGFNDQAAQIARLTDRVKKLEFELAEAQRDSEE